MIQVKYALICLFLFYISKIQALECQWWQIKVVSHSVKTHLRKGGLVKKHPRKEHCREKVVNGDYWGPKIKDGKPIEWSNQNEVFKNWKNKEHRFVRPSI